jgi:hypothetical protein
MDTLPVNIPVPASGPAGMPPVFMATARTIVIPTSMMTMNARLISIPGMLEM